ncbi:hypothetical protein [Variovorax sp. WS11]|uniref:hypothetical protein n=1 Tax=Variovorax sp. WS11 TaxID=1105204 RepID=UPI0013D9685C|nr:hypothetical protein [Variovorax sp. WS11]NDZ17423.1 hypothetical protein [Variovorax sp. WS11]
MEFSPGLGWRMPAFEKYGARESGDDRIGRKGRTGLSVDEIQQRYEQPLAGQQVTVRTRSGVLILITQAAVPELHVGDRVYVEGSGESARVLPQ